MNNGPAHEATASTHESGALADLDFNSFKRKVKASWGLDLDAYKRAQMERRLRATMESCGARSFQHYYSLLKTSKSLLDEFLDRVTINVSEFFRNPEHFEVLRLRVLPKLLERSAGLRVWSAGCSCGAEAYTVAILLHELAPGGGHRVLATDIDDRMLARARQGVYQDHELRSATGARLSKYFDRTSDGYRVTDEPRRLVRFKKHDLLREPFEAGFDLVLCRNVVIYFTDEAKAGLYGRFYQSLRPGGFLFVGGTERVAGFSDIGYESSYPFFYRKPEAS